jgi:hypothetical protein
MPMVTTRMIGGSTTRWQRLAGYWAPGIMIRITFGSFTRMALAIKGEAALG